MNTQLYKDVTIVVVTVITTLVLIGTKQIIGPEIFSLIMTFVGACSIISFVIRTVDKKFSENDPDK